MKIQAMRGRRMRRVRLVGTLVVGFGVLTASVAEALPTTYAINGRVTDGAGRSLASVSVSDGGQTVATDSVGFYRLPQTYPGYYEITANRPDLDNYAGSITVDVPLDSFAVHHITAHYRLTLDLDRDDVSVASADQAVTAAVDTWAPDDGTSCVVVRDSRTGIEHAAERIAANPNGSVRWEAEIPVPAGTSDGSHTLAAKATECGSGSAISKQRTHNYRIDSTPPVITALLPADGHNTYYDEQPLQAITYDEGPSGFGLAAVQFELTDRATQIVTEWTGTYNANDQVATTSAIAMIDGHDYTITATATDRAGNIATASHRDFEGTEPASDGGFRKIELTASEASLNIVDAATNATGVVCSLANDPNDPLSRIATCPNVAASIGASTVTVSGSRHSYGTGFVGHTVDLRDAELAYQLGPITRTTSVRGSEIDPSSWAPKVADLAFTIGDKSELPSSFAVNDGQLGFGTLRVRLDQSWAGIDSATLRLTTTTDLGSAEPPTGACSASARTGDRWSCTTDPMWSWFAVVLTNSDLELSEMLAEYGTEDSRIIGDTEFFGKRAFDTILSPVVARQLASDGRVSAVVPIRESFETVGSKWLGDRSVSDDIDLDGDETIVSFADSSVTVSISKDPAVPARTSDVDSLEQSPSADPTVSEDPLAGPRAYEVAMLPQFPLDPGTKIYGSDMPAIEFASSEANFDVQLYALDVGGMRYTMELDDPSAPQSYSFDLTIPEEMELLQGKDGAAALTWSSSVPSSPIVGYFLPPRAVDRYGRDVAVTQTITRDSFVVSIDDAGAEYPILVDPTYQTIRCTKSTTKSNAVQFLKPYSQNYNIVDCPYWHTFKWATDYFPLLARIEHGGWRMVDTSQQAECSAPEGTAVDDHNAFWDFQVPCRMHDYCYDLVRIGPRFSYDSVAKDDCDTLFRDAMVEHCLGRSDLGTPVCLGAAGLGYAGVSGLGSAVRNSLPGGKGWPAWYDQFLWNGRFAEGFRYWGWWGGGTTASVTVLNAQWHNYARVRCGGVAGCYIHQTVDLEDYWDQFVGGERLTAAVQVRCASATSCPMTVRMMGQTTLGSWYELGRFDYTAPVHDQNVWWGPAAYMTLPTGPWYKVRYEVINRSPSSVLDVRFPTLNLEDDV